MSEADLLAYKIRAARETLNEALAILNTSMTDLEHREAHRRMHMHRRYEKLETLREISFTLKRILYQIKKSNRDSGRIAAVTAKVKRSTAELKAAVDENQPT